MTIICGKKQIFQSPNATVLHFIFFDDNLKYRSNFFFLCLEKSSTFLESLNLKSDMETVGEISIKDLLKQTKIRVYRMNHYPDSKNRAK